MTLWGFNKKSWYCVWVRFGTILQKITAPKAKNIKFWVFSFFLGWQLCHNCDGRRGGSRYLCQHQTVHPIPHFVQHRRSFLYFPASRHRWIQRLFCFFMLNWVYCLLSYRIITRLGGRWFNTFGGLESRVGASRMWCIQMKDFPPENNISKFSIFLTSLDSYVFKHLKT